MSPTAPSVAATRSPTPPRTRSLRLVRRTVPITSDFRGRRLLVREGGRLHGTPLLLVVFAIIAADIAFAVDSIPAAFAVTRDAEVIWTANAFALLGLGSLLALVDMLVRRFRYLDETIALGHGYRMPTRWTKRRRRDTACGAPANDTPPGRSYGP